MLASKIRAFGLYLGGWAGGWCLLAILGGSPITAVTLFTASVLAVWLSYQEV